jgi:hypothetical protein
MRDDIVVFLGPSLPMNLASALLDALYLPPADQGSVFFVAREIKPRAIVLIDGVFGDLPAVRHKEILWALSKGVQVYGAASMGAIRAAELSVYGMTGSGLIYRWYRANPMADDDEVAVATTPVALGSQPLSEALFDIRTTIKKAVRHNVLSYALGRKLCNRASATYFMQRTYETILDRECSSLLKIEIDMVSAFQVWLKHNRYSQKTTDAMQLLKTLKTGVFHAHKTSDVLNYKITEAWTSDLEAAGFDIADLLAEPVHMPIIE